MPHVYGVSYFSSKGPTGDGRLKPDLVAPGEKDHLVRRGQAEGDGRGGSERGARGQAGAGLSKGENCVYVEDSGTSMAAPHVLGRSRPRSSRSGGSSSASPEEVKQIFLSSATDLQRDRYFQGSGLVDLMRAIQSV